MKEPLWLDEQDALTLHDRLLAEHGGATGIRDAALLQSALARPRQTLAYAPGADVVRLAAAYTSGVIGSHPFVDGNKRTGFVLGVLFLEINGHRFTASEEEAANAVLMLASGDMSESEYDAFLRAHVEASRDSE